MTQSRTKRIPFYRHHRASGQGYVVLKRSLIRVGAFNLRLLFRKTSGAGTPRGLREALQTRSTPIAEALSHAIRALVDRVRFCRPRYDTQIQNRPRNPREARLQHHWLRLSANQTFTTRC